MLTCGGGLASASAHADRDALWRLGTVGSLELPRLETRSRDTASANVALLHGP